jgi:hypothetical protein
MPLYKVKDPSKYPEVFQKALRRGAGEWEVARVWEHSKALLEQRRVHMFRKSLRTFQAHTLAPLEHRYDWKTRITGVEGGGWLVWLRLTPKEEGLSAAILKMAEVVS